MSARTDMLDVCENNVYGCKVESWKVQTFYERAERLLLVGFVSSYREYTREILAATNLPRHIRSIYDTILREPRRGRALARPCTIPPLVTVTERADATTAEG